eukprot:CAMPEP_0194518320 /NCGR_PEP_ID=MMETSP0253-20130528/51706_1 /TAXON_ID=2966 /ORGANISM="Noctiluca scintillans" /LENGTH=83 /DNA_ID=CAMNT_0039362355 /DNA_START=112 /DNA_END=363 /DNA_ORIENTATION=+
MLLIQPCGWTLVPGMEAQSPPLRSRWPVRLPEKCIKSAVPSAQQHLYVVIRDGVQGEGTHDRHVSAKRAVPSSALQAQHRAKS